MEFITDIPDLFKKLGFRRDDIIAVPRYLSDMRVEPRLLFTTKSCEKISEEPCLVVSLLKFISSNNRYLLTQAKQRTTFLIDSRNISIGPFISIDRFESGPGLGMNFSTKDPVATLRISSITDWTDVARSNRLLVSP